jgi:hypothetical protein
MWKNGITFTCASQTNPGSLTLAECDAVNAIQRSLSAVVRNWPRWRSVTPAIAARSAGKTRRR